MAAPAVPIARVAERIAVKAGATEILQPAEVLRSELIVRELRVSDGHVGGAVLRMSSECVVRGSQAGGGRRLSSVMRRNQAASR